MKNAFYFTCKALHVLEIFKFLFYPFGCVEKRLDKKTILYLYEKTKANFKNRLDHK